MSNRQAKFCLDRNHIRWVLLGGEITRTTQLDDPTAGQVLPVSRITDIRKTSVERVRRSPLAKPAMFGGIALVALFGWLATSSLPAAAPGLILGVILVLWGLSRAAGEKEVIDAFQIVAPGLNPQEWLVVGSHLEVTALVEGVRSEMRQPQQQTAEPSVL